MVNRPRAPLGENETRFLTCLGSPFKRNESTMQVELLLRVKSKGLTVLYAEKESKM